MPTFQSFPEIQLFHNIVRFRDAFPEKLNRTVTYRGKVKLHGTNAGIRITSKEVVAQSRTQIITPQADNMGFAAWVESTKDYWLHIGQTYGAAGAMTVFGEWCGQGIQSGTAINQIGKKVFAVFAVTNDELTDMNGKTVSMLYADPESIAHFLKSNSVPEAVHILPWYGDDFKVDFSNRNALQEVADKLNSVVREVEPCDPWVKIVFGVEGIGEGIVYYPDPYEEITLEDYGNLAFKAKGEQHKVVKTKQAVQISPEIAASIDEFVTMFVTEPRLEQGLTAIGGSLEMKNIGQFLKWLAGDVLKESTAELAASNLTWDKVQKAVQQKAREWFIAKIKSV